MQLKKKKENLLIDNMENLKSMVVGKRSQGQRLLYDLISKKVWTRQIYRSESRSVVARGWGWVREFAGEGTDCKGT